MLIKTLKAKIRAVAVASGTAHAFPMRAVGPPLPGEVCAGGREPHCPREACCVLWPVAVGAVLPRRDPAGPRGTRPQCTSLLPPGQSLSFQEPPSKKGPSSSFMSSGPCVPKFRGKYHLLEINIKLSLKQINHAVKPLTYEKAH